MFHSVYAGFFLRWFPYNRFPAATAYEKCWTILATTVFHTVYSYIYLWSLGSSRQSSSLSNWSRNYRHNRKSVAFIWSHQSLKVICSDGSSRVEQWYDKQSSEHLRKRKSGKLIEFLGPTRLYPGNVLSYITKCSREHTARYDWSIIRQMLLNSIAWRTSLSLGNFWIEFFSEEVSWLKPWSLNMDRTS